MKTDALTATLHLKKQMKFGLAFHISLTISVHFGIGSLHVMPLTSFEFLDKWSSASPNLFKGTHDELCYFFSFFIPFGYNLSQEVPTSTNLVALFICKINSLHK